MYYHDHIKSKMVIVNATVFSINQSMSVNINFNAKVTFLGIDENAKEPKLSFIEVESVFCEFK